MKAQLIEKIPRRKAWLQFTATRIHSEEVQVDYELVLPLDKYDCRGTFDIPATKRPKSWRSVWLDKENCKRIPLNRCMVGTTNPVYPFYPQGEPDDINTPFRDTSHSQWDSKKMGRLKIYYVTDGKTYLLTPHAPAPKEKETK